LPPWPLPRTTVSKRSGLFIVQPEAAVYRQRGPFSYRTARPDEGRIIRRGQMLAGRRRGLENHASRRRWTGSFRLEAAVRVGAVASCRYHNCSRGFVGSREHDRFTHWHALVSPARDLDPADCGASPSSRRAGKRRAALRQSIAQRLCRSCHLAPALPRRPAICSRASR